MDNKFNILNIQGILMYEDTPLIDFKISHCRLIYVKDLSNRRYYPWEFTEIGLTYEAFNTFFNDRVVMEHAQDIRYYLEDMGLKFYDFQALIKKMNGWDGVGNHWIKFDNMGAKCWSDILKQKYPIEIKE